jgi:hypothetical protein
MSAQNLPLPSDAGFGRREKHLGSQLSRAMSQAGRNFGAAGKVLLSVFQIPWQRRVWQLLVQHFQAGPYSLCVEQWPDLFNQGLRQMRSSRDQETL